jgi:hypothetical protein
VHPKRYTSDIHQEGAALRRKQKDGIALANVNGGEFKCSVPKMWIGRNSADQKALNAKTIHPAATSNQRRQLS